MEQLKNCNDHAGAQSRAGEAGANLSVGLCVTFDEARKLTLSALVDADDLANCVEKLLKALNKITEAEHRNETCDEAEELRSEYWRGIQSAIYEYRKRAARARAALTHNVI